jgi:hypothetical protein
METALNTSSNSAEKQWQRFENKIDLILEKTGQYDGPRSQNATYAVHHSGNPGQPTNQCVTKTTTSRASTAINQQSGSVAAVHFQEDFFCPCPGNCDCNCHLRSRIWRRSPPVLQGVIGFLALHYSGLALLKPACSSEKCNSYSSKVFKATYCLPRWLLMKAAHVWMQSGPFNAPTVALTLQRRTQEFAENSIYHLAERGDLSGVEQLIRSRLACPTDAADSNGYTALHVSIPKTSVHTCSVDLVLEVHRQE